MIEIRRLTKYFGRFSVLRNLDLSIGCGEFIALFGRNGAGKTTFLRIIAGLSRSSSGTCTIRQSSASPPSTLGYLAHHTSLYPDLTALENLRFFSKLIQIPSDDRSLIRRLEEVGLAGREMEPVRNFSRGMQQRLAIVRAFQHDPAIILMDEPFTGLDQEGSDFLKKYLMKAHSKGKTCIVAIHDIPLGYEMADRLIIIEKGVTALDRAKSSLSLAEFQEKYKLTTEAQTASRNLL
jgi:heme exporter protein A